MALSRAKFSVIVFSWTAGVMYSTLFTMPYLLVAHYHSMGTVSKKTYNKLLGDVSLAYTQRFVLYLANS